MYIWYLRKLCNCLYSVRIHNVVKYDQVNRRKINMARFPNFFERWQKSWESVPDKSGNQQPQSHIKDIWNLKFEAKENSLKSENLLIQGLEQEKHQLEYSAQAANQGRSK